MNWFETFTSVVAYLHISLQIYIHIVEKNKIEQLDNKNHETTIML